MRLLEKNPGPEYAGSLVACPISPPSLSERRVKLSTSRPEPYNREQRALIPLPARKAPMQTDILLATVARNADIFRRYNRHRIDYLREYLSERKRNIFDLLPVLLHEDSHVLPGNRPFEVVPAGITCFEYTPQLKALVMGHFPAFEIRSKAKPKLPIVFLAVMGSAGSIAFNETSDLDFWVGMETARVSLDEMDLLQQKLRTIEQWAMERAGLEIHFFVTDINSIRREQYGELDKESCGSALGKLLKDEFYRTGIFLQGKIPWYWLMPAGIPDSAYDKNITTLRFHNAFEHEQYIDLGNVSTINQSEFVGAVVWHLLKGLRSPFKSVLKMALLDMYSHNEVSEPPLCEQFKKSLQSSSPVDMADPYLFMLETLREFYTNLGNAENRRLMEESFIIRNLLPSVGIAAREHKARTQFFIHTAQRWGWDAKQIHRAANVYDWHIYEREDFQKRIVDFLLNTYKAVRERTLHVQALISDRDLTVAGKKLLSVFEHKHNKIPFELELFPLRHIISIELKEETDHGIACGWSIMLRMSGITSTENQIVRYHTDPMVALAWCCLNKFYTGSQQIRIKGRSKLTANEAINLIKSITPFFRFDQDNEVSVADVLGANHVTQLYIIPNGDDPEWAHGIKSLFVLYKTATGELLYNHTSGEKCLHWLAREILFKQIGAEHLKQLYWQVHVSKGQTGTSRRISNKISAYVKEVIARMNWPAGP
ncbi:MAG: hypothetical protein GF398_17860 [Chitinivibrionales bacterium]|nr:hypothetical protein [Chitinivibrionales bacterium]